MTLFGSWVLLPALQWLGFVDLAAADPEPTVEEFRAPAQPERDDREPHIHLGAFALSRPPTR